MALIGDPRKTLYLATPGTHVGVDHDAFQISRPEQDTVRVPVVSVDALVCFGRVQISTYAVHRCSEVGVPISWITRGGRFRAAARYPTSGNVLLRVEQHAVARDDTRARAVATPIVAAKILNSRTVLQDSAKDRTTLVGELRSTADKLAIAAESTKRASTLDELRGLEGAAAKSYFGALGRLVAQGEFEFAGRNRRPATDPVNALLSFGYALLRIRCEAACEHAGLDPQVGFLHSLRPGRASLALDLMEELRAPVVDRFVITLVNRRQVTQSSLEERPGGSTVLTDEGREVFLTAWDAHLAGKVAHRVIETKIERRQLPFLQGMLLARHLRGDLAHYLPFRAIAR